MSEKIHISEIPTDRLKDLDPRQTRIDFGPSLMDANQFNQRFLRTPLSFYMEHEPEADFLSLGSRMNYFNTKILMPTLAGSGLDQEMFHQSPTYYIDTEINYDASQYLNYINGLSEGDIACFYKENDITKDKIQNFKFGSENFNYENFKSEFVVFGKNFNRFNTENRFPINNKIVINFNESKYFVPHLLESGGNLLERLMVLMGIPRHTKELGITTSEYSLENFVDNYDLPFAPDGFDVTLASEGVEDARYDFLQHEIFKQVVKTISMDVLSYEDIFRNKQNINEVLFFKIEKYLGEFPSPQTPPIQTFLVPAVGNHVNFIDTQIKQTQTYTYKVTSYSLVFGAEYSLEDWVFDKQPTAATGYSSGGLVSLNAKVFSSIKIYENVVFEKILRTLPRPPLPPYVSFHNRSDSSEKIKIYLALQKGRRQSKFISIHNNDSEQFNNIPNFEDNPKDEYGFSYNEEPARFEVFRMNEKPKSYSDFSNHRLSLFSNDNIRPDMIITDFIKANTKYYYTFRAVNYLDSVSNPTPVYEVELLKDSDESKIIFKTIELVGDEVYEEPRTLNFKNLFQITPTYHQTIFDFEHFRNENGNIDTFREDVTHIGTAEHKIWGRKFKIRVKSNDSGKVIDFNVKFNLIKKISEVDFSE